MNILLKRRKNTPRELDSFFDSRIVVHVGDSKLERKLESVLHHEGFLNVTVLSSRKAFFSYVKTNKHDLIVYDIDCDYESESGLSLIQKIRSDDPDTAIITFSSEEPDRHKMLELNIDNNFIKPFLTANFVKAAKRAIGSKNNYEIGMQFFDALFGMQMCTHRDLHQRTFDHVIRTTKIYGKFLLFLNKNGHIDLTSWALKNCLMASLVHDIGKLLVMHGIMYKEGKLSSFEFEQIRRHPWHSVTALLGGQDIEFFAKNGGPIETVSGYNEKNLGAQVQRWIFKIMKGDLSSFDDIEKYFSDMGEMPFVHSLNKDLLYIVFRHHDAVTKSYHTKEELNAFGRIIGREINVELNQFSPLDVVANSLSLCDMFDALLDVKRDYRKTSYSSVFAIFLLYSEMRSGKFFSFLLEQFVRFLVENERMESHNPFYKLRDGEKAYKAIENVYDLFRITKDQETDFNDFLKINKNDFETYAIDQNNDGLIYLNEKWLDYYTRNHRSRVTELMTELKNADLLSHDKEISNLSLKEVKVFDLLLSFYNSYSSSSKQKRFIQFLVHTVLNRKITPEKCEQLGELIKAKLPKTKKELEHLLISSGYDRFDLFEVFSNYDENMMVNDLNDFLRRQ